ncbi:alpha/beta hydrolase family esterase [Dickeya lacustris]|uniref:Polyhydroxybutyrate depolymerase n=1 Tax=Dickeya lacustris TaxID=2259638 RepID=A0ABY8G7E9_9GAMM|nr:hypothetical protein [Dickeya lacustris]WFN55896.1 hypothetical protein O1Q98_00750 [Dickeya lacustris]
MQSYKLFLFFFMLVLFLPNENVFASDNSGNITEGKVFWAFSDKAGGERSFYIVPPRDYNKYTQYKLMIIFPGTHTTGKEMHEWFGKGWWGSGAEGIESQMTDTLFIYPDQKYAWNGKKGWALGPFAQTFGGREDLAFVDELITLAIEKYNVNPQKIFATGHSWGGDMAAVAGCFLGDKLAAIAPIAANRPYWFETQGQPLLCKGHPAVWTIFGLSDDFFGAASPNGLYGREQNAFWRKHHSCTTETESFIRETVKYSNCNSEVLFTLYAAGQYSGGGGHPNHQPPDYLIAEMAKWFTRF